MDFDKVHFRHSLFYEFQLGHSAAEAYKNLCVVFGTNSASQHTCERWFTKFRSGDFSLEDEDRAGRPVVLNENELLSLVKSEPRLSTREMEKILGYSYHTICNHLQQLGFVQKLGVWVPHKLTDDQKWQRVSICSSLLCRRSDNEWIKLIVTGDEKWVLYVNHTRKRQWLEKESKPEPEPKDEPYPKKVMLSVFWDFKGIIWYEFLPYGTTITAQIYSNQLQKLATQLQQVRPEKSKVLFLHDNARPHVAKETKKKLKQLEWEVLPHAPYSPDLAPSDYHLFRSLSQFLKEKSFDDFKHLEIDIKTFFSSKSPEFYAKGILELPDRWSKVVDSDGEYIID